MHIKGVLACLFREQCTKYMKRRVGGFSNLYGQIPWHEYRVAAILRKRGTAPPCYESGSWVALRFSRCGKILSVSQRTHLRFFHIAKIEYQSNLHFPATGRSCRASPRGVSFLG